MPSSYTNTGIELIEDGEQAGSWGETTNDNLQIISRMVAEAGTVTLSGTTHTLTISDGVLSEGHYGVLVFSGSPSGTNTVTISPNDAQRIFTVRNLCGQTVTLTQGGGASVSVADDAEAIVYCDGSGSGANVVDVTSTYLRKENNLSDLSDAPAALGNLGLTATAAEINTLDGFTGTTTQLNTATSNSGSYVPSGGIIMWSGSIVSIPSGWVLCDGNNSTPNLQDRFIVGAGSTYAVDATGGAATVTLSAAQMPAHNHTVSVSGSTNTTGNHAHSVGASYIGSGITSNGGYIQPSGTGATTSTAGNHSHSVTASGTTSTAGSGSAHENLPPYYALAYIMKT